MGFMGYLLIAIVCWGITPILEKTALRNLSSAEGVLLRSLAVAVCMGALMGFSGQYKGLHLLNWQAIGLAIIGGLISAGIGQFAYFAALKTEQASMIVPMAASYPLVTMFFSILLLGEPLSIKRALGAVMVVVGVVLVKVI